MFKFYESLHLLQSFRKMLQCCSAVKLQKRFVDCETSHQHEGEMIMTEFKFWGGEFNL